MKKIIFIVLFFCIKQINAQICFNPDSNFVAATGPDAVISADFNGDGFADLAVANQTSNNISVLLGTGTGSFGVTTNFPISRFPNSIISADFNGDGFADLAVATGTTGYISILL